MSDVEVEVLDMATRRPGHVSKVPSLDVLDVVACLRA
jgi:hypothetical protein